MINWYQLPENNIPRPDSGILSSPDLYNERASHTTMSPLPQLLGMRAEVDHDITLTEDGHFSDLLDFQNSMNENRIISKMPILGSPWNDVDEVDFPNGLPMSDVVQDDTTGGSFGVLEAVDHTTTHVTPMKMTYPHKPPPLAIPEPSAHVSTGVGVAGFDHTTTTPTTAYSSSPYSMSNTSVFTPQRLSFTSG